MNDEEKTVKIIDLFKKSTEKKETPKRKKTTTIRGNNNVVGDNNTIVNSQRVTVRHSFQPGPEHISPAQANRLNQLMDQAVEVTAKHPSERQRLHRMFWKQLHNRFKVATYLLTDMVWLSLMI